MNFVPDAYRIRAGPPSGEGDLEAEARALAQLLRAVTGAVGRGGLWFARNAPRTEFDPAAEEAAEDARLTEWLGRRWGRRELGINTSFTYCRRTGDVPTGSVQTKCNSAYTRRGLRNRITVQTPLPKAGAKLQGLAAIVQAIAAGWDCGWIDTYRDIDHARKHRVRDYDLFVDLGVWVRGLRGWPSVLDAAGGTIELAGGEAMALAVTTSKAIGTPDHDAAKQRLADALRACVEAEGR